MLISEYDNIVIAGMAVAVPAQKIKVEAYAKDFGQETVQKFSEMAGVKEVLRAKDQQTASDLGYEAAARLFEAHEVDRSEIGILIFVSQKPDYRSPATAFVLQKRLGLGAGLLCMDINLACSGFVYGLQTAHALLAHSNKKYALLITADTSYKTLSPEDRTMIMLFGDSGSATLLEKTDKGSPKTQFGLRTNGKNFKSIITPAGAFRNMQLKNQVEEWSDGIKRSDYNTHMKGMDVFAFSITDVPRLMKDFLAETKTTPDDYDTFALHQANLYILKQLSRKVKIPFDKIPVSIDRYGNNSSNAIPLLLCQHFAGTGQLSLRTFICGFGAGLSWACGAVNINPQKILPIFVTDAYFQDGY